MFETTNIATVDFYHLILALLTAFLTAFATTPLVKKLAFRIKAVDVPKDNRRMHKKPMPLIGGLAIFLGFTVSAVVSRLISVDTFRLQFLPLWCGAALIVILGIFDDIFALKPWLKFIGQFVAAAIPVVRGITITDIFGIHIDAQWLSVIVTLIWIVGLTNAINLIDGLDGLACGVSSICCLILMVVSMLKSEPYVTMLTAALAGAALGFLPYNLNPATIFMGDTGAMFLGYTLSVISIMGVFKLSAAVSFIIPIIIFGLPIFDTAFAIIRRVLSGRSPFAADRGHLHHKLVDHGFNVKQSVLILYVICSIFGFFAIMVSERKFSSVLTIIIFAFLIGLFNLAMSHFSRNASHKAKTETNAEENNNRQALTEQNLNTAATVPENTVFEAQDEKTDADGSSLPHTEQNAQETVTDTMDKNAAVQTETTKTETTEMEEKVVSPDSEPNAGNHQST